MLAFSRTAGNSKVVTVLNLSDHVSEVSLQFASDAGIYREYFTGAETTCSRAKLSLKPWGYQVYVFEKELPKQIRTFESLEKTGTGLRIRTNDGTFIINTFTENAFEIAFEPKGETNPPSNAAAGTPKKVPAVVSDGPGSMECLTNGLAVIIQKSPFSVKILATRKNRCLRKQAAFLTTSASRGFRFRLDPSEQLFGGGERAMGMNRRGKRLKLYNRASYGYEASRPHVLLHARCHFFQKIHARVRQRRERLARPRRHSTRRAFLRSRRRAHELPPRSCRPVAAVGHEVPGVTGRQPMPPRWALGNIASRMGYHSQTQVEEDGRIAWRTTSRSTPWCSTCSGSAPT